MRNIEIVRNTSETKIRLSLNLDGSGKSNISSGCGFLVHMLTLFARHSRFDLTVDCDGDTYVDYHHTAEDIGICLGEAFTRAIGDKRGINRYGDVTLPMDEALAMCACDVSGRGMIVYQADFQTEKIGDFDTQLIHEFFQSLAMNAGITLHIVEVYGQNSHHIAEAMFKGAARALREAFETDERFAGELPSTKGVL